ncbi:MAG TPA: IPTL-CTERM sorting domain-containing protein [Thiobacillus sp.]|nr:IPTL-CTERM sorting domain-containing protein [Thiobacillus sp.]
MTYKFSKGHAMNDQNASATQVQHGMPRVAARDSRLSRITRGLLAGLGVTAFVLVSAQALAATAPNLGTSATYGVLSSTYTNTAAGTTINGDLGYTTGPAVVPTVNGTTHVADGPYATAGIDQGIALADLNGQSCTSLGAGAVALDTVDLGAGPGVFPPGCYSSGGAMTITVSTTVTLNGAGVYIFRPAGALTTGANSRVVAAGGACESDVYWAPVGATTLGANAAASLTPTFLGTIIDDAGITLGHFANMTGRALAFGGTVTTDTNTITVPTCPAFVPPVTPPGGVALGKVFSPTSISAGGVSRLTITLSNDNVGVATLSSPLIDNLPTNVVVAPTPNAATSCGVGVPTAVAGTSIVSLPIGTTIPGGAPGTCSVTVDVTAATAGSYTNTLPVGALVTSNGSNATPASAVLTVTSLAATSIPTLSEWAMIMLVALLAMAGFVAMRRQV